ncbi:2-amino-4-hydroxy-6-hydroxymethyldihydropteridine pyrophosphokinase [Xylanimonas cellulosilytica DSM 15894]|uniref:Bifunctional folate synthesis protein n=1 Tax=Xylanimonas cellulosilytica (strain DSM 15894 / JCM 12276 / CECT 5975 / KCTC 9989 / LMG 20990 / NBRC 107835 / XIL07) TaxID=446471 RepID=D1BZ93_XYLCX|nr:2-amino-4-hydroxy-6-hydroxymethyldihydropteridine diphosphokinase [Xylanimonas cellulosilytica]ACZ31990.1 2-amino-4-hydroxy-6-hydroxymethyldihydropteridine pyrophosphokinase [Xylanimonas cellulosilytica DSM 15894]
MTIFASPVLGPDGLPLDQIRLTGVTATGHHGVLPHERAEGQEFGADVVLHLDTRPAAAGDALADTVSYAEVAEEVHAVLAGSPADLVETVAERIAAVVLERPAVVAVDVRVHKPQAPITVPFDDVEVAIRRDRVKVPVVTASLVEPAVVEPAVVEPVETPVAEPLAVEAVETLTALPVPAPLPAPLPVPPPLPVSLPIPAPTPVPAHAEAAPPAPPVPEPEPEPVVDRLDVDPAEPVEVVLAIGGNLGDPQASLRAAVTDLDRLPGIQVTEVSPLARTTAVGGPDEQPDYLNAVLIARTTLSPRALLRATQAVENAHGRVREERWGPRTLDVDIVRYGSLVAVSDDLVLPHPRAHERAFVLVPWAEVQPDADLPGLGGGPVAQLAETAPDRGGIRWMALDWLTETGVRTGSYPTTPAPEPVPADDVAAADDAVPADDGAVGNHALDGAPYAPTPTPTPAHGAAYAPLAAPAPAPAAEPVEPAVVTPPPFLAEPAPVPVPSQPPAPTPLASAVDEQPGRVHTPVSPFAPVLPAQPAPAPSAPVEPAPAPPVAPTPPAGQQHAPIPPAPIPPAPGLVWQPVAAGTSPEAEPAVEPAPEPDDAERWIPYDPDKER